jgi:antitoxin (DNA-binding transcriptional repressor) of toxin-antitoxin stability system
MYHLVRATLRDLRYNFAAVENLLEAGQEVQVTRRKRVVARLLPPADTGQGRRPDFLARLRKIYGRKRLAVSGAELLSKERERR